MWITAVNQARTIAATGQRVEPGETVEVDQALGESLCEQPDVWAKGKAPKKSEGSDKESDR